MEKRIKLIAFDLDNTLVDFIRFKTAAAYEAISAMRDAGLPLSQQEGYDLLMETYWDVGIESDEVLEKFFLRAGVQNDPKILAAGIRQYQRIRSAFMNPYPRTIATLIELLRRGFQLAILTDAPRLKAWKRLAEMRLMEFFDYVLTKEEVSEPKPAAAPFLALLQKANVKPYQTAMVGDNPVKDVQGAQNVGICAILARYGTETKFEDQLEYVKPDYEISAIDELIELEILQEADRT
ncbi:MAG: HAD-IA family hydrolase [Candidatus Heimdallarchaeota archaeon]